MSLEKPYLSPSAIGMYTKCGRQYMYRYIENKIMPPAIAMLKGSAVHKGGELNFKQKVKTRKDLPKKQIVDASAADYTKRTQEEVALSPIEKAVGKKAALGAGLDSTVRMAGLYAAVVAPKYQPVIVEQKQRIAVPESNRDILAILDVADDRDHIVELKTSTKTANQAEWDASVQLTIQAMTFQATTGRMPRGITVEQIVDKKDPEVITFQTTRDASDYRALINRYASVLDGINKGVFIPAIPGTWYCSPRFCGYWGICDAVNSERKAAAGV